MTETSLYFGQSGPDGVISEQAWETFRSTVLVETFPEGFTVLGGTGYWRSEASGEGVSEGSKVVIRLHAGSSTDEAGIKAAITEYRALFQQESVLRVDHPACVTF